MDFSEEGVEMFAAAKVLDGLFVGNEFGAQDIDFLRANKIRLFVNCSPSDVPCFFSPPETDYLCVDWADSDEEVNQFPSLFKQK